jgi:hypothetical protein
LFVSDPNVFPPPEPDDRDDERDLVTEDQLRDLGIDPALVRVLCPWATELSGHGGKRCWAASDLTPLLGGNPQ